MSEKIPAEPAYIATEVEGGPSPAARELGKLGEQIEQLDMLLDSLEAGLSPVLRAPSEYPDEERLAELVQTRSWLTEAIATYGIAVGQRSQRLARLIDRLDV